MKTLTVDQLILYTAQDKRVDEAAERLDDALMKHTQGRTQDTEKKLQKALDVFRAERNILAHMENKTRRQAR